MEITFAIKIFSFITLIVSVVLHEVAHGYAALFQGDKTAEYAGRLTLNPLKHLDIFGSIIFPIITSFMGIGFGWAKPVPYNPDNLRNRKWGEAIVAAAGPATNLIIALVFAVVIRVGAGEGFLSKPSMTLAAMIVLVNVTLAIFNLVPMPPLDGSKILFALIPRGWGFIRNFMERYQLVLVFLYVFVLWQYFTPIVDFIFMKFTGFGIATFFS